MAESDGTSSSGSFGMGDGHEDSRTSQTICRHLRATRQSHRYCSTREGDDLYVLPSDNARKTSSKGLHHCLFSRYASRERLRITGSWTKREYLRFSAPAFRA
jgi:hypothetical protein